MFLKRAACAVMVCISLMLTVSFAMADTVNTDEKAEQVLTIVSADAHVAFSAELNVVFTETKLTADQLIRRKCSAVVLPLTGEFSAAVFEVGWQANLNS